MNGLLQLQVTNINRYQRQVEQWAMDWSIGRWIMGLKLLQ